MIRPWIHLLACGLGLAVGVAIPLAGAESGGYPPEIVQTVELGLAGGLPVYEHSVALGLEPGLGIEVNHLLEGSVLAPLGVLPLEVITAINGEEIGGAEDMEDLLTTLREGDPLVFTIRGRDGQDRNLGLTAHLQPAPWKTPELIASFRANWRACERLERAKIERARLSDGRMEGRERRWVKELAWLERRLCGLGFLPFASGAWELDVHLTTDR